MPLSPQEYSQKQYDRQNQQHDFKPRHTKTKAPPPPINPEAKQKTDLMHQPPAIPAKNKTDSKHHSSKQASEIMMKHERRGDDTLLSYQSKRFTFPGVPYDVHQGALKAEGLCMMVEMGLHCPHCAEAFTAKFNSTHQRIHAQQAHSQHTQAQKDYYFHHHYGAARPPPVPYNFQNKAGLQEPIQQVYHPDPSMIPTHKPITSLEGSPIRHQSPFEEEKMRQPSIESSVTPSPSTLERMKSQKPSTLERMKSREHAPQWYHQVEANIELSKKRHHGQQITLTETADFVQNQSTSPFKDLPPPIPKKLKKFKTPPPVPSRKSVSPCSDITDASFQRTRSLTPGSLQSVSSMGSGNVPPPSPERTSSLPSNERKQERTVSFTENPDSLDIVIEERSPEVHSSVPMSRQSPMRATILDTGTNIKQKSVDKKPPPVPHRMKSPSSPSHDIPFPDASFRIPSPGSHIKTPSSHVSTASIALVVA